MQNSHTKPRERRKKQQNLSNSQPDHDGPSQIDVFPIEDFQCFSITKLVRTNPETRKQFIEEHAHDNKRGDEDFVHHFGEKKLKRHIHNQPERVKMELRENLQKLRYDQSFIHQWGVFTTKPIKKNEAIIEYIGELIRLRVVDKRQVENESEGINGSYIFQLDKDKDLYIDATHRGGLARYINHCCDPNCETTKVEFDNQSHIVIFAKRDISPYEELSYDYKMEYETKEKRIRCLCGSPNCKKWLNWNEEAEKELLTTPANISKRNL